MKRLADPALFILALLLGAFLLTLGMSMVRSIHPSMARLTNCPSAHMTE